MAYKTRAELKALAKENIQKDLFNAIMAFLIYIILFGIATATGIGAVLFSGVLSFGILAYFINLARNTEATFNDLFSGFTVYLQTLLIYILTAVFVILWSLLLIVPGIIAAISYSQVYFILKDNPQITALEAIKQSKAMMNGHKWRYFVLGLSFFWWMILTVITFGIALLYVGPYMTATFANFYQELLDNRGSAA